MTKTKIEVQLKMTIKYCLRFLLERLVSTVGSVEEIFCKRNQKYEFVQNIWKIQRPHIAILTSNLRLHFDSKIFLAVLSVLVTRPSEVQEYE